MRLSTRKLTPEEYADRAERLRLAGWKSPAYAMQLLGWEPPPGARVEARQVCPPARPRAKAPPPVVASTKRRRRRPPPASDVAPPEHVLFGDVEDNAQATIGFLLACAQCGVSAALL